MYNNVWLIKILELNLLVTNILTALGGWGTASN